MSASRRPVVAIDGPAGAGKSTVARLLAPRLGLAVLDTGAMYRALAVKALRHVIEPSDGPRLAALAERARIAFDPSDRTRVLLDGDDVTESIRTIPVGQFASAISVHASVRRRLVELQREIVAEGGFILEGRDTTTVVAPDADLKVFLTASIEERARRRWLETRDSPDPRALQEVVKDIVERDHRDYTRPDSPLCLAEDAVIVESYGLTPEDVADRISALLEER